MSPATGLAISTTGCVGFSMICSLCEATLYSVPLSAVSHGVSAGDRRWRVMQALKDNPGRPIAGILISNTIANTAGATLAGAYAQQVFHSLGLSLFSAGLVLAILLVGEIIPKMVGVTFSRQVAPVVAYLIRWLVILWTPVIVLTELITRGIQRRASGDAAVNEWELAALMRQGVETGAFRDQEARIVESVLRLDTIQVRDIMTPRTVMVAAPAAMSIAEAAQDQRLWQHGRIPVYDDQPDAVVGIVLRHDILRHADDSLRTLRDLAVEAAFVPELMRADQLLDKLIGERRQIALVIDEYGQIEGLVTLEDVLESVIGREIVDELDTEPDLREKAERLAEARREQLGVADSEPTDDED